jgi:hypothetical protein
MPIPSNLLPINTSVETVVTQQIPKLGGVPTNLIPVNSSTIEESLQSIAGEIPTIDTPEIPELSTLSVILPNSLFRTGSIDQVRARTNNAATTYLNGLPAVPTLPSLPTAIIPRPRIPSYGQIKDYIETKIDRIKLERQKASQKALDQKLKQKENPFAQRESLKNIYSKNTVLSRFTGSFTDRG